ncbi:hypothetical protein L6164_026453 [Bauhinia variegata]|uniref:Uncharacterized protein n=1 Tax=Bauhinia variegata TaxID=167791 RepID=A0ACB9LRR1_BAUVA|nr:hypothetical protein L6164_026453 [Bauhinia variegata]
MKDFEFICKLIAIDLPVKCVKVSAISFCVVVLRLLREMGDSSMIPNMASYSSTVGLLCRDGKWKEAEILLGLMINSGFRKHKLWPRRKLHTKPRLQGK